MLFSGLVRRKSVPMNTVTTVRRSVRTFKVTIKHARRAAIIVTTFALFAVRGGSRGGRCRRAHRRRFHVQRAALRTLVHEGAHRRRHGALVLGAAVRRHRIRRAVFRRRRREREEVMGLRRTGGGRLRLVRIRAGEGHPRAGMRQRLRTVRQPGDGRVEVGPTYLT